MSVVVFRQPERIVLAADSIVFAAVPVTVAGNITIGSVNVGATLTNHESRIAALENP